MENGSFATNVEMEVVVMKFALNIGGRKVASLHLEVVRLAKVVNVVVVIGRGLNRMKIVQDVIIPVVVSIIRFLNI